ncbi:flavin-containing monooxygenase [Streptomyces johnsoniae]|uniref:flavin-containing monooxygenase n=1 Tax=Streptomyces johnsoniae TaxID=3075532 RepID=UPI00374E1EF2
MEHVQVAVIGGGQSGLAAARAAREAGLTPVVLEASARAAGSWPSYYDSLTLFSPARFSALPGLPFGGDGDRHPHRDEVVDYLTRYAADLDADIRTGVRVEAVEAAADGFVLRTADGSRLAAAGLVTATGSFGNPLIPALPGRATFPGTVLHAAAYRGPAAWAGLRIVVVGGGNSAVQIAHELGRVARVTVASRAPLAFLPQRRNGRDLHHWLTATGFDALPPAWLARVVPGTLVLDDGRHRRALDRGIFDRRPMFTALDGEGVVWSDGTRERVDAVLLATGYRPALNYLAGTGALDAEGSPLHVGGLSLAHPGLVHLGLEFQRSFASNTLRGVAVDAAHVMTALAAHVRGAAAAAGL